MDFSELIRETLIISDKFKTKLNKQNRMLDLVEETGELAHAMLMVDGGKTSGDPGKQRTKADIADALADILYDLVILAKEYDIELDDIYPKMLEEMKNRFEKKDLI